MDYWLSGVYENTVQHLSGQIYNEYKKKEEKPKVALKGDDLALYLKGKEIYEQDAYCGTCHQENGKGLTSVGYPTLSGTEWVLGNQERLIKLSLKGLHGPIKVLGKQYDGQVPMTAFEGLLDDEELAAVLTYVRNSFGNSADVVSPEYVAEIREKVKDVKGFYKPADLLKEHPMNNF